jgi:hypothetical protein
MYRKCLNTNHDRAYVAYRWTKLAHLRINLEFQVPETRRSYGPYTRTAMLARPRRRTSVSRFLMTIRKELTEHVGGHPTVAQRLLIERIGMALLRIELMDKMALNSDTPGVVTERQSHDYLAWVNTAGRLLRTLGLEPAASRSLSPSEALHATYVGTPP